MGSLWTDFLFAGTRMHLTQVPETAAENGNVLLRRLLGPVRAAVASFLLIIINMLLCVLIFGARRSRPCMMVDVGESQTLSWGRRPAASVEAKRSRTGVAIGNWSRVADWNSQHLSSIRPQETLLFDESLTSVYFNIGPGTPCWIIRSIIRIFGNASKNFIEP